ncbi:hypothetical protein RI367_000295 [Sorochytrium milnesiophthora]
MPGKAKASGGKAAGGGKKKKKSKKELEQERLLLEEQRRQEEEAELQRQHERELELQKLREELEAYLEQEEPDFEAQRQTVQRLIEKRHEQLQELQRQLHERLAWQEYLQCSQLPDLLCERDVRSYFHMFGEIKVAQEEPSFEVLERYLPEIVELSGALELYLSKALDNGNLKGINHVFDFLLEFAALVRSKWDAVTAVILQYTDHFPREPTENLQLSHAWDSVYNFGLWCNFTKNPRHKLVDFGQALGITVTLPKPITLVSVAVRMMYERQLTTLIAHTLRQNTMPALAPVDGILFLDMVDLPDPAKTIDSWTLRPIVSPDARITSIAYPFANTDADMGDSQMEDKDTDSEQEQWPMLVEYKIPPGLFLYTQATVCWWSADDLTWRSDGITNVDIDRVKGMVKFRSTQFRPTAVVQSMFTEFPFADWFMEPTSQGAVRLVLQGKLIDLELEMCGKGVTLVRPMTDVLERDFKGVWMNPSQLLLKLSSTGLNFRAPDAAQAANIDGVSIKDQDCEMECIVALSVLAPFLRFQRHPLNCNAVSTRCIFEVAPPVAANKAPDDAQTDQVFDTGYKVLERVRRIAFTHVAVQPQDGLLSQGDGATNNTTNKAVALTKEAQHKATVLELIRSCWPDRDLTTQNDEHVQCSEVVLQVLRLLRVLSYA